MRFPQAEFFNPYWLRTVLRSLIAPLLVVISGVATAEIRSPSDCEAAIETNASVAREDAAAWGRQGGGVQARLCEAAALEAMGATATAARTLTNLAETPDKEMTPDLRAVILQDAARLWIDVGRADIAREAIARANQLHAGNQARKMLQARAEVADDDWAAAQRTLEVMLQESEDALTYALYASALRRGGNPQAARIAADRALELESFHPVTMFEAAAARAETGSRADAGELWLRLISLHPDHNLATAARHNLQALSEAGTTPILRPQPRPDQDR